MYFEARNQLKKMQISVQKKELTDRKISTVDVARAYFRHLNPVAVHISNDIDETRLRYGQLWCTLRNNEQNDIINESLIKPEITMRYFKKCSTLKDIGNFNIILSSSESPMLSSSSRAISSSSYSYGSSRENAISQHTIEAEKSLASVVLKSVGYTGMLHSTIESTNNNNKIHLLTAKATVESKPSLQIDGENVIDTCAFDGKVFKNFSSKDDLCTFADEHFHKFNYRTKSQISLRLFYNSSETLPKEAISIKKSLQNKKQISMLDNGNVQLSRVLIEPVLLNDDHFNKIQKDLNSDFENFHIHNNNTKSINKNKRIKANDSSHAIYSSMKYKTNYIRFNNANDIIKKQGFAMKPTFRELRKHSKTDNFVTKFVNDGMSITNGTYYSTSYNKLNGDECINLMRHCDISISSEGSEIIDSGKNDEKNRICENVQLLNDNLNLQKGYDFLNNW